MTAQEEAPILELDVSLSRKEYLYFILWSASRLTSTKILLLLSMGGILLIMVTRQYTKYLGRYDLPSYAYGALIILSWVFLFSYYIFFALKAYASSKLMQEPMHYSFSKDGIAVKTPSAESNVSWNAYYKAIETKRYFIIYLNIAGMYLLPKQLFQSPAQMETFRNLLRTNMPPKTCRF